MSALHYRPENGEWISMATIEKLQEFCQDNPNPSDGELVDYMMNFHYVDAPTAAQIGSPHTQRCVTTQRTKLCFWVIKHYGKEIPKASGARLEVYPFLCDCPAASRGRLRARIRYYEDGGWDIGYVREGAQITTPEGARAPPVALE